MDEVTEEVMDELVDLLGEFPAGLTAVAQPSSIEFRSESGSFDLEVYRRVAVTPSTALRLIDDHTPPGFVVGDIVHAQAADFLARAGWSFWDRRGRLRVWNPESGYRLDTSGLRSFVSGAQGPDLANAVAGAGGLAVALTLLTAQDPPAVAVREIARTSGMNASTISRARAKLLDAALIDADGMPLYKELFWATSRAWRPTVTRVNQAPADGWVLGGDAAAARHGAPVFGDRARWYTDDRRAAQKFARVHGDEIGTDEIAVAPTPLVLATAMEGCVHPVIAALDVSMTARGRESLISWTSPPVGQPVWL